MTEPRKRVVRIPFMRSSRPVGLGTVVKAATTRAGIKPCERCKKRAEWLNKRVEFRAASREE